MLAVLPELARPRRRRCASSGRSATRRSRAACGSSPGPSTRCAPRTRGSTCAASAPSPASSCPTSTAARARRCTTASPPTACSRAGSSRARASERLAARQAAAASDRRAAALNDVRLQGGLPVSSDPRLGLDAPAPAARDPGRLGRGLPRVTRRSRASGSRSCAARSSPLRARLRRGRRRHDARRRVRSPYVLERITRRPSRRAAPGRTTTRSRTPRKASRAGRRGAARAGRGRR